MNVVPIAVDVRKRARTLRAALSAHVTPGTLQMPCFVMVGTFSVFFYSFLVANSFVCFVVVHFFGLCRH